jgi:CHAT domain-containing protein
VLTEDLWGPIRLIDLGEADRIDELIAGFRASMTGGSTRRGARDLGTAPSPPPAAIDDGPGSALRTIVFDSLLPALGGRRQLFLSPDGDLTQVPFEVLPLTAGRRLIDEYRISYLSTGRDVLRFSAQSDASPSQPWLFADPDFDLVAEATAPVHTAVHGATRSAGQSAAALDRGGWGEFIPLPGTRAEAERVGTMLGVRPWLGADALEGRLKTCHSPHILHIATHGFFLADPTDATHFTPVGESSNDLDRSGAASTWGGTVLTNPLLRSGLALAGANTWRRGGALPLDAEDGIVTAEDVSGLDLLATELVVLSACETGLGEVHTGEGVFGLRRAFMLAGAKTLVMSLWQVPDQQTQELMSDFYTRLLAGEGRAEALRAAQLTLKAREPHPFYWGGFICIGNPHPLTSGVAQLSRHTTEDNAQPHAVGAVSVDTFTEHALQALLLACEEARRLNHPYVGTEHLLLGLVAEGEGAAGKVLAQLGVKLTKTRAAVEYVIGRGEGPALGQIDHTPQAKKVIALATDEARRLRQNYVGTEHLLLGLIRERKGVAAGLLERLSIDLERVRTETLRILS